MEDKIAIKVKLNARIDVAIDDKVSKTLFDLQKKGLRQRIKVKKEDFVAHLIEEGLKTFDQETYLTNLITA